ncbi:CocE/NonD family hydrolase [soil metagenome]
MSFGIASQPSKMLHDVRFLYDQRVPMRDGISLSTDVFLPQSPGRWPTIVFRTPYQSLWSRWVKIALWWAQRGYAFVIQDCRGKFESDGEFYAYANEGRDAFDTLDWVVEQPWCLGKIGTWGRSYGGLYQWLLGPLQSPHLTCMAPHVINDDYFRDYHYVGGAFQLTLSLMAAVCFSTNVDITQEGSALLFNSTRFIRQLPLIDMDKNAIGREIPFWREWLLHDRFDDYWAAINTTGKHHLIDVPVLQQCGWYDAYPNSTFRHWNAMTHDAPSEHTRAHQRVIMGPWSHSIPSGSTLAEIDFGPDAYVVIADEEKRWFDYWLKGEDTGIGNEPPIRLFTMGENRWRFEDAWPLRRTEFKPLYLHSQGQANSLFGNGTLSGDLPGSEPYDRFSYDPGRPVPSVGGNNSTADWSRSAEEPIIPGPIDQRIIERRDDVLVYTSERLERDLEVTGPIEMVLFAASSALDTDFTVKLVDVFPDGYAMNISEGIIRARYRNDDSNPELLERGEVARYLITMYPTSNVFQTGHRLRVDISSSNFPRFSRNLNTGESVATGTAKLVADQRVLHTSDYPSHILLPVIPR